MPETTITIPTMDGPCTTALHIPDGTGPWPAVIVVMDAGGVREPLRQIARRIASWGYVTATPDLYHRVGPVWDLTPGEPRTMATIRKVLADPEKRAVFQSKYYASAASPQNVRVDFDAIFDFLAHRPEVKPGKGAVTGYCMGGNIALRAATVVPDRLAVAASFHGGNLVTDAPDSIHREASKLKAFVYAAGAVEDATFSDEAKDRLIEALAAAHVRHEVETYPGAHHGFAMSDHPSFDEAASERHFTKLQQLLRAELP